MNKKVAALFTALSIVCFTNSVALADPLSDKLNSQKQQLEKDKNSLSDAKKKREAAEIEIEKLDNQIESLMKEINDTKTNISKTQDNIKIAQKDLEVAQKNIEKEQDLFNKRIRAMYINGTGSYVSVILESKGLSDFISKIEAVKKVMEFDKKVIANLKEKRQVVQGKKDVLDAQNSKLVALKNESEQKLSKLNDTKATQDKAIKELQSQEKLLASKVDESQAQINSTVRQMREINQAAPKYNPSRGAAPISSNNVIAYAYNFLGKPYQWGGNGPSSFDCSGFVKYVYGHFGVDLPRVADAQQGAGAPISRSNLQPGDLVFFGSPAHHVGIYVGNDCFVHAPKTNDVIRVSSLSDRSDFSGAVRVK